MLRLSSHQPDASALISFEQTADPVIGSVRLTRTTTHKTKSVAIGAYFTYSGQIQKQRNWTTPAGGIRARSSCLKNQSAIAYVRCKRLFC